MPNIFDYVNGEFINGLVSKLKSKLATVALSGKYSDLSGKPTIPPAVSVKGDNESTYRTGEVNITAENVGALSYSKKIQNGEDLNAYLTEGFYYIVAADLPSILNKPNDIGNNFTFNAGLHVLNENTWVRQVLYIAMNGRYIYYMRESNGVTWVNPWIQLPTGIKGANETEYRGGNVNLTAENVGAFPGAIAISLGADLNEYLEFGVYFSTNSVSGSILHKPTTNNSPFSLVVLKMHAEKVQLYFDALTKGIYKRNYVYINSWEWTDWIQLPTGVKGNNETTYRGGNVNLTPENIGAVPTYNSTIIGADTDWNDIVDAGSYKVQIASILTSSHLNSPVGLYGYGTLTVIQANENNSEKRKIQIYIPDLDSTGSSVAEKGLIAIRSCNSNVWRNWSMFKSSSQNDATYVNKSAAEITGNLTLGGIGMFKRSTGQGVYNGKSNNNGWVVFVEIQINTAYLNNGTIELEVGGMGRQFGTIISLQFSMNGIDPALNSFQYYGGEGSIFRVKKKTTSTWQIIAKKAEDYHEIYVMRVNCFREYQVYNGVIITYPNTMLSGEPDSTWIAPTLGGEIGKAAVADSLNNFFYKRVIINTGNAIKITTNEVANSYFVLSSFNGNASVGATVIGYRRTAESPMTYKSLGTGTSNAYLENDSVYVLHNQFSVVIVVGTNSFEATAVTV